MDDSLQITPTLAIPNGELRFRYTTGGGPGGQHVNKTATQVELTFDVLRSPSLTHEQRARLLKTLHKRIDSDGVLHLESHATRSQLGNKADVMRRFAALLAAALKPVKPRKATKPSKTAKERRLTSKKARGELKRQRGMRDEG